MKDTSSLGKYGEDIACEYLVDNKYAIVERNKATQFGEIDIIAKSPDKTLVFIEVKTIRLKIEDAKQGPASYPQVRQAYRQKGDVLLPEDNMTFSKMKKSGKISEWYFNKEGGKVGCSSYRLDLVAICMNKNSIPTISHYTNLIY